VQEAPTDRIFALWQATGSGKGTGKKNLLACTAFLNFLNENAIRIKKNISGNIKKVIFIYISIIRSFTQSREIVPFEVGCSRLLQIVPGYFILLRFLDILGSWLLQVPGCYRFLAARGSWLLHFAPGSMEAVSDCTKLPISASCCSIIIIFYLSNFE